MTLLLSNGARTARNPRAQLDGSEMTAAEEIQNQVWGPEIIPTPKEMLIPVQHEGGLLAGAFTTEDQMVGLVFSFPTSGSSRPPFTDAGHPTRSWRGLGIGARLKWFQRDWCLDAASSRCAGRSTRCGLPMPSSTSTTWARLLPLICRIITASW